ncbi:hypothetical protein TNCV_1738211 [Trichonephila clavipes]|nr:hypothetical protein TNCV_1738211 [Trichonephila clavipes]
MSSVLEASTEVASQPSVQDHNHLTTEALSLIEKGGLKTTRSVSDSDLGIELAVQFAPNLNLQVDLSQAPLGEVERYPPS